MPKENQVAVAGSPYVARLPQIKDPMAGQRRDGQIGQHAAREKALKGVGPMLELPTLVPDRSESVSSTPKLGAHLGFKTLKAYEANLGQFRARKKVQVKLSDQALMPLKAGVNTFTFLRWDDHYPRALWRGQASKQAESLEEAGRQRARYRFERSKEAGQQQRERARLKKDRQEHEDSILLKKCRQQATAREESESELRGSSEESDESSDEDDETGSDDEVAGLPDPSFHGSRLQTRVLPFEGDQPGRPSGYRMTVNFNIPDAPEKADRGGSIQDKAQRQSFRRSTLDIYKMQGKGSVFDYARRQSSLFDGKNRRASASVDSEGKRKKKGLKAVKLKRKKKDRINAIEAFNFRCKERITGVRQKEFDALPESQQALLNRAFANFEQDGFLQARELRKALKRVGLRANCEKEKRAIHGIVDYFRLVDKNVDFFSFCLDVVPRARDRLHELREPCLRQIFHMYDVDESGELDEAEVRNIYEDMFLQHLDLDACDEMDHFFSEIVRDELEEDLCFTQFRDIMDRLQEWQHSIVRDHESTIYSRHELSKETLLHHRSDIITMHESFEKARHGLPGLGRHHFRSVLLDHGLWTSNKVVFNKAVKDAYDAFGGWPMSFDKMLKAVTQVRDFVQVGLHTELDNQFRQIDKERQKLTKPNIFFAGASPRSSTAHRGEINTSQVAKIIQALGLAPRNLKERAYIQRMLTYEEMDVSEVLDFKHVEHLVLEIYAHKCESKRHHNWQVARELHIEDAEVFKLLDLFFELDAAGCGTLSNEEIWSLLRRMSVDITSVELRYLYAEVLFAEGHQISVEDAETGKEEEMEMDFGRFLRFIWMFFQESSKHASSTLSLDLGLNRRNALLNHLF
jgi:Ca2+-binding EF-hand superfamily protein